MNNDLVSVVIATYNMGDYIESAIDSILKQSYQNFELIVVDDGSVDDTEQRMAAYGDNAKIKYIKQE
ncbi:MAG TPA: glycosyltransferase family A protein, partial [Pseudomonadales bacterium]